VNGVPDDLTIEHARSEYWTYPKGLFHPEYGHVLTANERGKEPCEGGTWAVSLYARAVVAGHHYERQCSWIEHDSQPELPEQVEERWKLLDDVLRADIRNGNHLISFPCFGGPR
jgi:hypothetical protein